LAIVAGAVLPF